MKFTFSRKTLLAAGSLTTAAVLVSLVPFNMGGCAASSLSNVDVSTLMQGAGKAVRTASLSEKDEPALGESVALQATNRYPIYPDQRLNTYVTLVGRTVGAASALPSLKYYFAVLDSDQVNAFSGPHGFIFITRGALSRMRNESELAGVLGHEIGHVCKHHGLNAVRSAGTADAFKTMAASEQHIAGFSQGADSLGDVILNTGFSQPQEEEADQEGVKYVIAAGYDPHGYLRFLQRLQAEQGSGGHPFGTHPGLGDRVNKVRDQISHSGHAAEGGAILTERFHDYVALR